MLDQQELQYSSSGIIQAFENVAGVSMDTSGGLGTLGTISVRGLKQQYIGVRFNGMDITDPSGTQLSYDFGALTGMGLGQVEFVKGSQSAVFGSEAVGGVINLKTLSSNDEGSRGQLTVDAGSNETYSSSLSYEIVDEKDQPQFLFHAQKQQASQQRKQALEQMRLILILATKLAPLLIVN